MKYLLISFLLLTAKVYSQNSKILERLVALENAGKVWYNIDGYSVTSENFNYDFDEKGLKKVFKVLAIKNDDEKAKDDQLVRNNYVVYKEDNLGEELVQRNSYYIVENLQNKITVVWFAKTSTVDKEMERELTNLIVQDKIPVSAFVSMHTDTINFGNRNVALGSGCYWTFLNTVQCPYLGEMNWSVHKTLEDAKNSIESQMKMTHLQKGGEIKSEEAVDIEFEDVFTKAKKVIYNFTGITKALTSISGGKTLTIYYVAQKVRGNYISCVLSFWNNDQINPETKLPPLLEKVMKLK